MCLYKYVIIFLNNTNSKLHAMADPVPPDHVGDYSLPSTLGVMCHNFFRNFSKENADYFATEKMSLVQLQLPVLKGCQKVFAS